MHIERARSRKANAAVDAILAAYPTDPPAPDALAAMSDDGWRAVAALVGRPFESVETRDATVAAYRARLAMRVPDPFDGLEVW